MAAPGGEAGTSPQYPCGMADCDEQGNHGHLRRFLFGLPEVPNLDPDSSWLHLYLTDLEPKADGPAGAAAKVRIHRLSSPTDPTLQSRLDAILQVASELGLHEGDRTLGDVGSTTWTAVADVITGVTSPAAEPDGWDGDVRNLGPLHDPFIRALQATRATVRAANLASSRHAVLPTYERTFPVVHCWTATTPLSGSEPSQTAGWDVDELRWEDGHLLLLEHANGLPDEPTTPDDAAQDQWGRDVGLQMPGASAREHLIHAQRLLHVEGEYGRAVVHACSGLEILCTAVLSAVLWDEAYDVRTEEAFTGAIDKFKSGTPLAIAQKHLPHLLGGDWSSPSGSWQQFRAQAAGLRNRVVHGGYDPSRQEAIEGMELVDAAQLFVLNALADRANKFPRAAYLLVGIDGLQGRGLFVGKVRRFLDGPAQDEPDYRTDFSVWHHALTSSLA